MKCGSTFSEILAASTRSWNERKVDELLLSLAMPIKEVDPLNKLPVSGRNKDFTFLWDCFPGLCIAASGQCHTARGRG